MSTVIKEYGLKVSEKKSKVVCINGIRGIIRWKIGSTNIDETEEYKYLGVTVKGGPNGAFKVWEYERSKWYSWHVQICCK